MIGSLERKKCKWLFFTVSNGKRESGAKQSVSGKSQGSRTGSNRYSGDREKTGYENRTWSAGDKYGVDKRGDPVDMTGDGELKELWGKAWVDAGSTVANFTSHILRNLPGRWDQKRAEEALICRSSLKEELSRRS